MRRAAAGVAVGLLLVVLTSSRRRELSARACDQVIGPLALAKRARTLTEPEVGLVAVVVESDHAPPAVDVQDVLGLSASRARPARLRLTG